MYWSHILIGKTAPIIWKPVRHVRKYATQMVLCNVLHCVMVSNGGVYCRGMLVAILRVRQGQSASMLV